jgi:phosphoribosylglycinamide formyltransferase 1
MINRRGWVGQEKIVRIAFLVGQGGRVESMLECVEEIPDAQVVFVLSCIGEGMGIKIAKERGIEAGILDWAKFKDMDSGRSNFCIRARNLLLSRQVDLIIMAGWIVLMTKGFIDDFKGRIVNIHPSILPKYPGLGEKILDAQWRDKASPAGCTLHYVDCGMDSGEIILQGEVDVTAFSSKEEFIGAVHKKEEDILCVGIQALVKKIKTSS